MKKLLLCSLLLSTNAFAIVGGTDVIESEYPQFLKNGGCSGAIIAGKYILTAAHCDKSSDTFITHPDYQVTPGHDVALAKSNVTHAIDAVSFLSDVPVIANDLVSMYGWSTNSLKRANLLTRSPREHIPKPLYLKFDNNGHAEVGDSGAPVLLDNKIVAVQSGIDVGSGEDYGAITSRIEYSRDFILNTINDWHSPTELKFTGAQTIEIQSLHVNDTNLAARWNADTLTTGDVTVIGGTCVTDMIAPFGTCTLDVTAGAGEGKIKLTDNNIVTINRAAVVEPDTGGSTDKNNGGGGSFGWLGLLALSIFAARRYKNV